MKSDAIKECFASSIERERMAHAYLITGQVRGGSSVLAVDLARMVLCEKGQTGCGVCDSCRKVDGRSHPDMVWIEPRLKSRKIAISDIRDVQSSIYQTSYMGAWKVCVVAGADRMDDPAANALLKSLEEPPPECIFFLLAENPQYLLPTIVSRCQRFDLASTIDPDEYEWYGDLTDVLSAFGGGVVQRMSVAYGLVSLLKDIKSGVEAAVQDDSDYSEDLDDKVLDARISSRYREERTAVMTMIVLWYRDILMFCSGCAANDIYHKAHVEKLKAASEGLSVRDATANIEAVEEMERLLDRHLGEDSVFLDGFSRIISAA